MLVRRRGERGGPGAVLLSSSLVGSAGSGQSISGGGRTGFFKVFLMGAIGIFVFWKNAITIQLF